MLSVCLFAVLTTTTQVLAVSDKDGDGLSDEYEQSIGTEAYLADTDGDGISDADEVGKNLQKPRNSDGDNYIDALDSDDDGDGLPTFLESKIDTDKDGKPNHLDTDADNDGLSDGDEAGAYRIDKNLDGIDDAFDTTQANAVDANGDGINDDLKLPDHNNDGVPDYLDGKYKKRAMPKPTVVAASVKNSSKKTKTKANQAKVQIKDVANEVKATRKETVSTTVAKKKEAKITDNRDTDNDGLTDAQEIMLGTNPRKRDSDDDKLSDAIEIGLDINAPLDSDHDKIIDALDNDDDNDGVLTQHEDINKDSTPINDDTDNDGVPDFLDANDDGDDRLTRDEGHTRDTDGDGILDYLDKNDGVKDQAPKIVGQPKLPEEPEVVVLYDGNQERFDKGIAEDFTDNSIKNDATDQQNLAEQTLGTAIDEAIEQESANNKIADVRRPIKVKNVKVTDDDDGFLSWLTSLWRD